MKTSNKILLAAGTGPVLVVLMLFLTLRIFLGGAQKTEGPVATNLPEIKQSHSVGTFDAVSAQGIWDVEIVRSEHTQVIIHAPEDIAAYVRVEKRGNTLLLDYTSKPDHLSGYPKAFISLPNITAIHLEGVVNLDFTGFTSDSMSIQTLGCILVKGFDNRISRLHLEGEGLSKVDLSASAATHANVSYEGVYKVELLMTGGELTGQLHGLGKVSYVGSTSRQEIEIDGPGRVVGP